MLLDEDRTTDAKQSQRQRCAAFGALVAEKIRAARNCRFSLLPHDELSRLASGWYDASAQVMLNGNYAPITDWTQVQARMAAEQQFDLEDVLELLRFCRACAIQNEKWSEDIFSVVDDAVNEALVSIADGVSWPIPATLNYLKSPVAKAEPAPSAQSSQARSAAPVQDIWSDTGSDNRRDFGRNCLRLPIRVRIAGKGASDEEITLTQNVSRSGVYFLTRALSYKPEMALKVTYPYWTELGAINREYKAKVVRINRLPNGWFGVAVEFTESLGPRMPY